MHIHILQLCVIQAAASFIHLEPRNVSVLRGREVRFNCSTNAPWDVMNWRLGEDTILVVSVEHGTLARSESISTVNHSMSSLTVWELILSNSSFSQTVQEIRCELLPTNLKSSSALFVQEKGSVRILEGDLSVQRGVFVTFHCQAIGWYPEPSVLWMVNGTSVDRSDYNTSSIQETNNLFNSTSELQLKADTSTTVECWASVSAPLSRQNSSVKLTVESSSENKASFYSSWADNLSCERRSVADETSGKVNLGYNTEDITSSGHSDLGNRADSTIYISSSPQVPDIVIFSSQNQDLYSNSAKKTVRQVTTV
ncbi:immunoglobulin superfamily member 5 isoform X2 [Danio aesculapii]|uniref:immunoglobulin superfamily member 5 isoform X2 n=1 Tax=Danio aesculapii TaxID=1142201 RepID=UPI0024BF4063|nr:immunoglobulin superfamily member 5 isoform X2 [Danio aesculapii]